MTQPELAKELSMIVPGIDAPLISKMEKGICEPPALVQAYIESEGKEIDNTMNILSTSQASILAMLIQSSEDRPVTREELVIATGNRDNANRKDIMLMRQMGLRISASSGKKGYWLATTESQYKDLRGEYISRIKSLTTTLKAMDGYTKGQQWLSE